VGTPIIASLRCAVPPGWYTVGMRGASPLSDRLILIHHGVRLLRGRVLRWRLETFGLYMPSLPNRRPWWRPNRRALKALVQHRHAYCGWLLEMRSLRTGGPRSWWESRLGERYAGIRRYVEEQNQAGPPDPPAAV